MGVTRIYFGGTFDPPHVGHEQMLQFLLAADSVDFVHLVPTFLNPLQQKKFSQQLQVSQRIALIEFWLQRFEQHPKFLLEELEWQSQTETYTVETLKQLKQKYRDTARWVLAIGSDNLKHLHQWKFITELLEELDKVWVFKRGAEDLDLFAVEIVQSHSAKFEILEAKVSDVSSSEIREQLYNGRAVEDLPVVETLKAKLQSLLAK